MSLPKFNFPKKAHYIPLAEDVDIFALFAKVRAAYPTCFLAESLGEASAAARYSLIGFGPRHIIRAKERSLFIDDQEYQVANPYQELRALVPQDHIARRYAGGLFGYLSYEAVNYLEPGVAVKAHPLFDQFLFGVYTDGLVHDTMTGELTYFYYDQNRIGELQALLQQPVAPLPTVSVAYRGDTLTAAEHARAVISTKQEILAGNTFQCEVGFKSEYAITGCPLAIYGELRQINPSPYMFYLQHNDLTIFGASPELLLRVSNREATTLPLAGTIRRGATPAEDIKLARALLNDPKEIAEHVMLVDMHRNDIGRVARFGTVKVERLMEIQKFSHVQHIGSTITGILRPNEDMFTALAALLPGGVLSGAPKVESIKIIDRNEPAARGPYGGALGSLGFNGDATLAIPIRSLFIKGSYAYTQTASGIVYDSEPAREYQEIKDKLVAMQKVLAMFSS